jgi:hypothetical protein
MTDRTERSEGHEGMPDRPRMTERTERSGHEGMPDRPRMTERTERSEGHEGMPDRLRVTVGRPPRQGGTPDRGIEELLRGALSEEADTVGVSPNALQCIRGRVDRRRARWWLPEPGPLRAVGMAVATAAVVAAVVAGLGGTVARHRAGDLPSTAGRPLPGNRPVPTANLPVYYLGPAAGGQRLYREYHLLPVGGTTAARRIEAAVGAMLGMQPSDPNYRSPWPADARVAGVSVDGPTATVDLTGAGAGPADPQTARMALEQLVWTATAASVPPGSATPGAAGTASGAPTGLTSVVLRLDGRVATSLWGTPVPDQPLHRRPAVDVQAPVWIIDPQAGTVQDPAFTVNLAGIAPEAAVRLRIRDATGAEVSDEPVHLSKGAPQIGAASVRVTLVTGAYTVEAYLVSARDGSEQGLDSHRFTVG